MYPNARYPTFEACNSEHLADLLQLESLRPSWATPEDLSLATDLSTNSPGLSPATIRYIQGVSPSPCLEPCTQTSVTLVYSDTQMLKWYGTTYPTISIQYNPSVEVTTHFFSEFQVLVVFQDLGISLGLWLGVGAIQVMEPVARFLFIRLKRKGPNDVQEYS